MVRLISSKELLYQLLLLTWSLQYSWLQTPQEVFFWDYFTRKVEDSSFYYPCLGLLAQRDIFSNRFSIHALCYQAQGKKKKKK